MVGWHHQLNGHEFEQAPGDGKGQGSLAGCRPWVAESDTTERHAEEQLRLLATTTEPLPRAWEPLLKPAHTGAHALQQAHHSEKPAQSKEEQHLRATARERPPTATKTTTAKKSKKEEHVKRIHHTASSM